MAKSSSNRQSSKSTQPGSIGRTGAEAKKPTAALILLIVGGLVVFVGGLLSAFGYYGIQSIISNPGAYATELARYNLTLNSTVMSVMSAEIPLLVLSAIVGIIVGIALLIDGIMVMKRPGMTRNLGIIAIVLSVISLASNYGGFIIGFILSIIGGILAFRFKE